MYIEKGRRESGTERDAIAACESLAAFISSSRRNDNKTQFTVVQILLMNFILFTHLPLDDLIIIWYVVVM